MIDSIFNFPQVSPTPTPRAVTLNEYERHNALIFRIESHDFFSSLSALLGFVEETLSGEDHPHQNLVAIELEAIRTARKDLQYLHTHCRIEHRP